NLANLQGGPDNITVIVVHVVGEAENPPGRANAVSANAPHRRLARRLAPALKRLPWPLILLILGIGLAFVAIYLNNQDNRGALPTFVVAAITLLSGLAGVLIQ